MARIEDIERRLLNWARWRCGLMRGGLGYASVDLGAERVDGGGGYDAPAVIPTSDVEASETDQAVMSLPGELRRTVEVCYLDGGGVQRHAAKLACSESTIKARIWRAHRLLSAWYAGRAAAAREQRARVEALQRAARP